MAFTVYEQMDAVANKVRLNVRSVMNYENENKMETLE